MPYTKDNVLDWIMLSGIGHSSPHHYKSNNKNTYSQQLSKLRRKRTSSWTASRTSTLPSWSTLRLARRTLCRPRTSSSRRRRPEQPPYYTTRNYISLVSPYFKLDVSHRSVCTVRLSSLHFYQTTERHKFNQT